jgi:glucokinase
VWAEALEDGDKIATRLIDRAVLMLAAGVASVQNVLDLEAVVIGGGLADRLGPSFVERIAKAMHPHLFVDEHPPDVLPSGLGDLGGATGAALLAADALAVHA